MVKILREGIYYEIKDTLNPQQSEFRSHMHGGYELFYFTEGDIDYIVGENVYHLKKDDLLLIRPTAYHYPRLLSDRRYMRTVINFPKEAYPAELLNSAAGRVLYSLTPSDRIARAFADVAYAAEHYPEDDALYAIRHTISLILLHLKYHEAQNNDQTDELHPLLSEILRYIDANLDQPLSLEQLSKRFYISPSWLTHTFRKFLSISVMQYITRKKVLYAQSLIREGMPPTKAAKLFSDANYTTFYRQYKRWLGINPKDEQRTTD